MYLKCFWNKISIHRRVGADGLLRLMLCQGSHGNLSLVYHSALPTEHAGKNSGKSRKGFHLPRVLLPSVHAIVFIRFTIMSSLHPLLGTSEHLFLDLSGCIGNGRELRGL